MNLQSELTRQQAEEDIFEVILLGADGIEMSRCSPEDISELYFLIKMPGTATEIVDRDGGNLWSIPYEIRPTLMSGDSLCIHITFRVET